RRWPPMRASSAPLATAVTTTSGDRSAIGCSSERRHTTMPEPRASIVVLTRNRAAELCCSLRHLVLLPGSLPVIVVDNASTDGTPEIVRRCFPQVDLVTCDVNRGAAGRNAGVARVRTPVVAFCDDDTW